MSNHKAIKAYHKRKGDKIIREQAAALVARFASVKEAFEYAQSQQALYVQGQSHLYEYWREVARAV
jgi:hypothetical protein